MNQDFRTAVENTVKSIPKGKTASYGEVARAAGFPGAARAVGTVMKGNQDSSVPCHRVVKADGSLGGYNEFLPGGKEELLKQEGIEIKNGKIVHQK